MSKKLFLLDGMALIYRAYFGFSNNHRINSKGLNTSAIFGFTNTLLEVLRKENPTHIAVVFDTSGPTARHEEFPAYKAHQRRNAGRSCKEYPLYLSLVRMFLYSFTYESWL
jgi:DNA polymerase-1